MEIKDGKIYLSFNHATDGFSRMVDINGFEIAGEDRIFYPAKVEVDLNNRILIVSNGNIPKPVAARYCFKNFQIGNLYNTANCLWFLSERIISKNKKRQL